MSVHPGVESALRSYIDAALKAGMANYAAFDQWMKDNDHPKYHHSLKKRLYREMRFATTMPHDPEPHTKPKYTGRKPLDEETRKRFEIKDARMEEVLTDHTLILKPSHQLAMRDVLRLLDEMEAKDPDEQKAFMLIREVYREAIASLLD